MERTEQEKKGITLNKELLAYNVLLKRMVMKRCVFGTDLNPLAVELAKLSLWLDSFTIGTPLTFLDHHIKCGNSLVGIWLNDLKQSRSSNDTLDKWTGQIIDVGDTLHKISLPPDITISEIEQSKKSYKKFVKDIQPLKTILDVMCSEIFDKEIEQKRPKDLSFFEKVIKENKIKNNPWLKAVNKSLQYSKKYKFFHWELEFPDAFTDKRRGFDLILTNPPWDAVKPDDDDFFSQYYPGFRRLKSKKEKTAVKRKLLENTDICNCLAF